MTFFQQTPDLTAPSGMHVLENLAAKKGWALERLDNGDLHMDSVGDHGEYGLQFTWSEEYRSLHITCAMDMFIPHEQGANINDLLAAINAKLWVGHFAIMAGGNKPAFRHTVLMWGDEHAKANEIEEIIETALGECERFYPAFQYAGFNGMNAYEAMTCALWNCQGEA